MFHEYQYHFVDVIDYLNNDNTNEMQHDLERGCKKKTESSKVNRCTEDDTCEIEEMPNTR
jgi:hypothetical protein